MNNQIPMVYLPSPTGVNLDDRPIREILDSARYPHNVSLNQWSAEIFKLFKLTQFFKEHERLEPDYKSAKTTRELVAIAKAHLFQSNLQPKQGVKKDIDNPPW